MRKLLLSALLALTTGLSINAQNCVVYLNLTSQHNIDTLSATTKACAIQGITVSGSGIINLEGLAGIKTINGPLYIRENPNLLNLNGLAGLESVWGEIDVNNNPLITNLDGFASLATVGNNVRFVDNRALKTVSGLSKLSVIPGFLSIGRNENLVSLNGLENITAVQGAIAFGGNPLITNLDPLKSLTHVGGFLYIGQNQRLNSVTGLSNLQSVDDYINFEFNDALTTLAGLENLDYRTPYYLKIISNPLLSFCSVSSVCSFMSRRGEYLVENNARGCANVSEIYGVCATLPVELASFTGANSREGNVLKWETASEVNNSGFEVQRSRNGKAFEALTFVPGNGDSKVNHQYQQWDSAPFPVSYYRLKQIDEDGTYAYSKIVVVKDNFVKSREDVAISTYPNPVKDKLTIKARKTDQPFTLRNADGRIIKAGNTIPSSPIDVSRISNGLYILTVGSETFKVLVNH